MKATTKLLILKPKGASTPTAITATSGSGQSANCGAAYTNPLVATITPAIAGVSVTFTAPASGASGTFASTGTATETVVTNGSGVASSSAFTANFPYDGAFIIVASSGALSAYFNLTNTPWIDAFARADGDLDNGWTYSAGVWTIASGKALSTPGIGSELAANSDMETGNPPTGYSASGSSILSAAADERTGGVGVQSLEVQRGTLANVVNKTVTVTAKNFYKVSVWFKRLTATDLALQGGSQSYVTTTSTDWVQVHEVDQEDTTSLLTRFYASGAAGTSRWDDFSVKQLTLANLFCLRECGTPNVKVSVDITGATIGAAGIAVAVDSISNPQNYVLAQLIPYGDLGTAPFLDVRKVVNGVPTVLAGITLTYGAGKTLALEYAGGVVRVFYDGVQIGVDYSASDAGIINNTKHGLFSTDSSNLFDNASIVAATSYALNGSATAIITTVTSVAALWSTSGSDDHLSRPALANDGTNWLAIYRAGTEHSALGTGIFHIRATADEAATWTNEDTFIGGGAITGAPFIAHGDNTDCGDGIIFVAPNDDIIVQIGERGGTNGGTFQYRSTDGGATFSDEGKINNNAYLYGGQDWCIVGSTIYVVLMTTDTINGDYPWKTTLYKSADNAATWTLQGTIEPDSTYGNEASVISLGGSNMLCIARVGGPLTGVSTYQYFSTDSGATWTARAVASDLACVARPRLRAFAGGIMLYGRQELGSADQTVVWYSPDSAGHWRRRYYPDISASSDCGYCDVLVKADGNFYMLTYAGTANAAAIRRIVFGIA